MIEDIFRNNNGYLHTKNIRGNRNLYYELKELLQKGLVVKMKTGLYKYPNIAELSHWQEISLMYPDSVIYLYSAFAYYNLSTYMPPVTHLAIDRKRKLKQSDYMPIQLHYINQHYFYKHIEIIDDVKIYNLERTICDAVKSEGQLGMEIMIDIIKNYYQSDNCNLDLLSKVSKEVKVEQRINQIMQIIINL